MSRKPERSVSVLGCLLRIVGWFVLLCFALGFFLGLIEKLGELLSAATGSLHAADLSDGARAALAALVLIVIPCLIAAIVYGIKRLRHRRTAAKASKSQPSKPQTAVPPAVGNTAYTMLKPRQCLSAVDYIVFDVETTGFSSATDRIIEIGAIKCANDQTVDSFTTYVDPDMHIPSNISRLTGITDADVKGAPQFGEIAKPLMDFIGDLPLVAHNGSFDARMLASELNHLGLTYSLKVIDTLPLARKAFPELDNHKLKTLIHALGLSDHEQQHRAFDDARVGHQLYLKCKEKLTDWL